VSAWPGWEQDVLEGLHATIIPENVRLLDAWHACEGGFATFNPLNTTQPEPGATNYNSVGVKNYPDQATGLKGTRDALQNGRYDGIVSDLRAGTFTAAQILSRNASEFTTWGTNTTCIANSIGSAPPSPTFPSPGGVQDPTQAHVAFKRMQIALMRELPQAMNSASSTVRAARRHLTRASKLLR